jgi:hypothetical protein
VFFKKPKEMLPILSNLMQYVANSKSESPIIESKQLFYYYHLKNNLAELKNHMMDFSTRSSGYVEEYVNNEINTFGLIYNKKEETFTKDLIYFSNQK